jgi:hypothetical protein
MAGPIDHESNQLCILPAARARLNFVEDAADRVHDVDIAALGVAADVIRLANSSLFQYRQ